MPKLWNENTLTRRPLWSGLLFVSFWTWASLSRCLPAAFSEGKKTPTHWLQGHDEQRWEKTARHLRGLDQAMVEIGYRYSEIYWAGKENNGAYVRYQLDKIELSLQLALERRPKRGASAETFLKQDLPLFRQALVQAQPEDFEAIFSRLTQACNRCHALEQVPFIRIQTPQQRLSPVLWRP